MRFTCAGLVATGVVLGMALIGPAAGADVRVDYQVNQKTFKKGATSVDMLTFALYDDDACTSLIYQTDIAAGDAAVSYDLPKLGKVKNGAKPAKVTVISTVLSPGAVSGPLYAMVTGAGVTAIGGSCQVQVGTEPPRANYDAETILNTSSANPGPAFEKLDDFNVFTKARDTSRVEVILNSRAKSGVFGGGATGVQFQVRVDDSAPDLGGIATITDSNSIQHISTVGVFENLAAGSHTVSVWVAAWSAGTSTGVILDPGGWDGQILVKEVD
jgi:hypothetical protein